MTHVQKLTVVLSFILDISIAPLQVHYYSEAFYIGCDYQADVCWQISNTIKQKSVGKSQILSSRRVLANLKYYQADDVNLGFESEFKFLSND